MTSISVFTTMTNPGERNDPWEEAINCYQSISKDLVIVGEDWPEEFDWGVFNKIYQGGFDKCKGDWVIRMDLDYFIHDEDIEALYSVLEKYKNEPGIDMKAWMDCTSCYETSEVRLPMGATFFWPDA